MSSSPRNTLALQLAAASARVALSDWQWRVFGFKARPRRGAIFARFVLPHRRAQELFLLREFSIAGIAAGLMALRESRSDAEVVDIGESAVMQLSAADGVPQSHGFRSAAELVRYFRTGLEEYRDSADSPGNAFFSRANAAPGSIFRGSWLLAIGRTFGEPGAPVLVIADEFRRT